MRRYFASCFSYSKIIVVCLFIASATHIPLYASSHDQVECYVSHYKLFKNETMSPQTRLRSLVAWAAIVTAGGITAGDTLSSEQQDFPVVSLNALPSPPAKPPENRNIASGSKPASEPKEDALEKALAERSHFNAEETAMYKRLWRAYKAMYDSPQKALARRFLEEALGKRLQFVIVSDAPHHLAVSHNGDFKIGRAFLTAEDAVISLGLVHEAYHYFYESWLKSPFVFAMEDFIMGKERGLRSANTDQYEFIIARHYLAILLGDEMAAERFALTYLFRYRDKLTPQLRKAFDSRHLGRYRYLELEAFFSGASLEEMLAVYVLNYLRNFATPTNGTRFKKQPDGSYRVTVPPQGRLQPQAVRRALHWVMRAAGKLTRPEEHSESVLLKSYFARKNQASDVEIFNRFWAFLLQEEGLTEEILRKRFKPGHFLYDAIASFPYQGVYSKNGKVLIGLALKGLPAEMVIGSIPSDKGPLPVKAVIFFDEGLYPDAFMHLEDALPVGYDEARIFQRAA